MQLQRGDVAVVTGGASGIGFALAERFATNGLNVVVADVEPGALDDAVARLAEHGTEVHGVPTDVSKEDQVQALAQAAVDRFGGVHVVCNNAGVVSRGDPWLGPTSTWEWVLGVNLWGVIHGIRAFLPHLALGGRGYIVNTASMAGLMPGLNPLYDATKHAVVALSEDLYLNLQAAGLPVGVSVLCPGWVNTALVDSERNWPAGQEPPAIGPANRAFDPHLRRALAEGVTPAAVAEKVTTCIEEDRFWVFTHPDWMELAIKRWDRVAEGVNPVMPERIPGMPPTEQLFAEALAAMAEGQ